MIQPQVCSAEYSKCSQNAGLLERESESSSFSIKQFKVRSASDSMVQDADGVSMTELNVGFLDISCEYRQELFCFFI